MTRYKNIYLWTLKKGDEHENMKPYHRSCVCCGSYALHKPMYADDLGKYLTSITDDLPEDMELYFRLRKKGVIWRVFKSDDSDEKDFKDLISRVN